MNTQTLTPWERFTKLLFIERKDIMQIMYYSVFAGLVSLTLPLGIQAIINLIQGAQISTSWIVLVTLVTIGVIFSGILQIMQIRIIETLQQKIFTKVSFELSYRFPKIKTSELRDKYPPEMANRFFDTLIIQKGLPKVLIDIPSALLQIIFALILLSFYNNFFIIFGIVLLGSAFIVFRYSIQKGVETSLIQSKYKYKVANWIQEIARSIYSFKLSGSTNLALEYNDELVSKYLSARESHFKVIKLQYIKMIAFKVLITAGLLIIGGALVLNQQMNIGQFVAAEIIILLVINSVEKLIVGLETIYDVLTSVEKLGQITDKSLESQIGEKPIKEDIEIEIDDISYSVPNRSKPILSNISLNIDNNSRILISGKNGSGKSTLLRIIAGLSNITGGNIYINKLSMNSVYINHYRSKIGLLLNEELPFNASFRDNLTFGKEVSDDRIFEVLNRVKLLPFIKELPEGLSTILHTEGKQMSFSVSKKIVLARAILKEPKLLILEDPLYQFNKNELGSIMEYLTDKSQPWGVIVASNNDDWKKYCNEIITLEEGVQKK